MTRAWAHPVQSGNTTPSWSSELGGQALLDRWYKAHWGSPFLYPSACGFHVTSSCLVYWKHCSNGTKCATAFLHRGSFSSRVNCVYGLSVLRIANLSEHSYMLGIYHMFSHITFLTIPWIGHYYYPHFIDEKFSASRGCPRSQLASNGTGFCFKSKL